VNYFTNRKRDRRGRDRMEVGLTTTYSTLAYPHYSCELQSRPWRGVLDTTLCVVSDLRQVAGFLRIVRFPPIIKVTATI